MIADDVFVLGVRYCSSVQDMIDCEATDLAQYRLQTFETRAASGPGISFKLSRFATKGTT